MPETSTIDPPPPGASTPTAFAVLVFAFGLAIGLYRFRRTSRDIARR